MKQCLLASVRGFGEMLKYDGMFQRSEKMMILFGTMDDDKEGWIRITELHVCRVEQRRDYLQ